MPENDNETQTPEFARTTSKKREIAATVTAAALTIALGMVASGLIEKVTDRVKNKIAPKTIEDE